MSIWVAIPALHASPFTWGGSYHLSISEGHCSHTPFTWAVRELHTKRYVGDPTTLLGRIVLRFATQQVHHRFLFMALVSKDRRFGNNVQRRLRCSGLRCTSWPSSRLCPPGRWIELRSVRYGRLNFNDPAAGGERVWD